MAYLEYVLQDKMTFFLQLICFLECQIKISKKNSCFLAGAVLECAQSPR